MCSGTKRKTKPKKWFHISESVNNIHIMSTNMVFEKVSNSKLLQLNRSKKGWRYFPLICNYLWIWVLLPAIWSSFWLARSNWYSSERESGAVVWWCVITLVVGSAHSCTAFCNCSCRGKETEDPLRFRENQGRNIFSHMTCGKGKKSYLSKTVIDVQGLPFYHIW